METSAGIVMTTRDQLKRLVLDSLRGLNLVEELLAERRAQAAGEA